MSATVENKKPEQRNEWENTDFLRMQSRLDRACRLIKLEDDEVEPLRHPKRALTVVIPTHLDNGMMQTFVGYRVHHDLALGPGKGGLRFHPQVNLGETAAMAMLMTWKSALLNLPFGGAHGGIRLDPSQLSSSELERTTRRYVSEIIDLIGPDHDIIGPDLNSNEQTMAWIMDTYSTNVGHTVPSIATGKPQSIGGSLGLSEAVGYGVALAAQQAAKHLNIPGDSPKVVVQGHGTVGSVVARRLREKGFTLIAVSDAKRGVFNPKGLDLVSLSTHIAEHGSMDRFKGGDIVTNEQLLELQCDILAPCAVANQIDANNASKLRCKVVVEGANAPTTPEADDILTDRKIAVMPDILANAAGVTVGYLEWVQGLIHLLWTEQEVYKHLDKFMIQVCERVFQLSQNKNITIRDACMQIALMRIMEARRLRGLYP